MSEKYDGIQGVWDGRRLATRDGNTINAPDWWLKTLPPTPMTGELWLGRGRFEETQSVVCREVPDARWASVRFMVFQGAAGCLGPYAQAVEQRRVTSRDHLGAFYNAVIDGGGEGIVITAPDGEQYKCKPVDDDDGELVDVVPGLGKNSGMAGAFVLKNRKGQLIRVSAGLTAALRKKPPRIGAIIKYAYNGLTAHGMPRHARFYGLRAEASLEF